MNNAYIEDDNNLDVNVLIGKTLIKIEKQKDEENEELWFHTSNDKIYKMYNGEYQAMNDVDVYIEEIIGDLNDLVGSPITMAEVVSQENKDNRISETWTFYKFATAKGYVTIRWYGTSNGHYSEEVKFCLVK